MDDVPLNIAREKECNKKLGLYENVKNKIIRYVDVVADSLSKLINEMENEDEMVTGVVEDPHWSHDVLVEFHQVMNNIWTLLTGNEFDEIPKEPEWI